MSALGSAEIGALLHEQAGLATDENARRVTEQVDDYPARVIDPDHAAGPRAVLLAPDVDDPLLDGGIGPQRVGLGDGDRRLLGNAPELRDERLQDAHDPAQHTILLLRSR